MNNDNLKTSQISCFFLFLVPLTKLIILPSIFAKHVKEACWLCATFCFLPDLLMAFVLILANKKHGKPFFSIAKDYAGKVFSKIIFALLYLYFVLKAIVLFSEQKFYIESTLYETTANVFSFLPIIVVSFYLSIKGLRSLGRCSYVCAFASVLGLFLVFFLSIPTADFTRLSPVFYLKDKDVFSSLTNSVFWFGDCVYLLFFMGNYTIEKHSFSKILLPYALGAFAVVFFFAVFYSVFASISTNQLYAVTQTTKYSVILSNVARFDYIASLLICFSNVFSLCVPIMMSTACLKEIFNFKDKYIPSIISNAIVFSIVLIFGDKLISTTEFINKNFFILAIFTTIVIPITVILLPKHKTKTNPKENQNEVYQN